MANMLHLTQWRILTGAPCSGKTSVIEELARQGYQVVPEAARAYLAKQLALGFSLENVVKDRLRFERHILLEKVTMEQNLDPETLIFFDRGVIDSIAYYRLAGLDPKEAMECGRKAAYHTIFLLDRLPTITDPIRKEGEETAVAIEQFLIESYEGLGYAPIRIPVMPVSERANAILQHLK